MQLVPLQKSTAQAIVNIFETGSIRGNYGDVTLLPGDSGQLTYGRSQTTLASGNLYLLIADYCARSDGVYSSAMSPFLPQLLARDTALNHHAGFRLLLKEAGDDPVMQEVQDIFFDRVYWAPAMRSADALGAETALGAAIVYDSTVHGSWAAIRDRTRQKYGELGEIGEKKWMAHYVAVRRDWLATYPNPLLHKTVYRMDALASVVEASNWDLDVPLLIRGLQITAQSLGAPAPLRAVAEGDARRLLFLTSPPMTGPDVEWLQARLPRAGLDVPASGAFDEETDAAVRRFQAASGMQVDGVVGPVTRSALEDISVTAPLKVAAADLPMPGIPEVPVGPAGSQTLETAPPGEAVHPAPAPPVPPLPHRGPPVPARPQPAVGDAASVADLKQHVTDQVQAGIQSLRDENNRLVQIVTGLLKGGPSGVLAGLETRAAGDAPTLLRNAVSNGRPLLATFASVAVLSVTEIRDWLVWGEAAPGQVPAGVPAIVQYLPKSADQLRGTITQAYQTLHALAASLPDDWAFRLRGAAIALAVYAVYRLVVRRIQASKLAKKVAPPAK